MVIIIHKLLVGSFTFLQFLSGTELLNLRGTPYIFPENDNIWFYLRRKKMLLTENNVRLNRDDSNRVLIIPIDVDQM
jgi:hypothetical protein